MNATTIKAQFQKEGISVAEWARARGYKLRTVYAVINGRLKCQRGIGHQIAIDLGLKTEPKKMQFRPMVDAA
jgi:gp16 family phage-associated protein